MRWWLLLVIVLILGAGLLLRHEVLSEWSASDPGQLLPIPEGDQEIAFLYPATNGPTWERFVAGVRRLKKEFADLEIDESRAFLQNTTDVPEIVLGWHGNPSRVRIRWYKLSGNVHTDRWVQALANRDQPPLAVVGGSTSQRAQILATSLREKHWKGAAPLFFITTATTNTLPDSNFHELVKIYEGRTFRLCFTNQQMASAICDFVTTHPELHAIEPIRTIPAAIGGSGALTALVLQQERGPSTVVQFRWEDDPYSTDLSDQFRHVITKRGWPLSTGGVWLHNVPYSVGGYSLANQSEEEEVEAALKELTPIGWNRSILILPCDTQPARRVLRAFTGCSPLIGKDMIAVTGDAVSLNNIYRDQEVGWNIWDIPVPLILFAHQNPAAWDEDLEPPTATDEVLLFYDLVEMLVRALYPSQGPLLDADGLAEKLRKPTPPARPYFKEDGDRLDDDGAHVILLQPHFRGRREVAPEAAISIYRHESGNWVLVKELTLGKPQLK